MFGSQEQFVTSNGASLPEFDYLEGNYSPGAPIKNSYLDNDLT